MTITHNEAVIPGNCEAERLVGIPVLPDEDWRPVAEFEDIYLVSSLGRIYSPPRRVVRRDGLVLNNSGKMLSLGPDPHGYLRFNASRGGKVKMLWVHHVVCRAFSGPCPDGMEVRHLDGNSLNNRASNLAYGTRATNIADSKRHGTFPAGVNRPGAILNPQFARDIAASNETAAVLAARYGVKPQTIQQIRRGETWASATDGARLSNYRLRGAKSPVSKLSENDVVEILRGIESAYALAKKFGVSDAVIRSIRHRRIWKHVVLE